MIRKTHNGSPGLWTAPNSELSPPGALKQALGCAIKRPGLIQKLTPMRQYSLAVANTQGHFYYGSRFYLRTTTGVQRETASGSASFTALTMPSGANVATPDGETGFVRTAEASGNLYMCASTGILKFDATTGDPYYAGIQRPLDVSLTLVAAGSLLATGDQVAYRVVFGFLDANANLVLGPPSGRVTTTGTAAQDVTVKAYLPTAIYSAANATSYFYQVYRTAKFTVDPGEEMRLVYQAYLTATDVSNKYVSMTDITGDSQRGTDLYTNPSQEGLAAANYAPPLANDIALFKGTTFYANTTGKHRARVQMLGTPTVYSTSGSFAKASNTVTLTLSGSPDLTGIPTDGTAYISVTGATSAANNGDFPITGWVAATSISYTNAAGVVEAVLAGTKAVATKLTIGGTNYYASLIAENTSAPFRYVVTTAVSSQSTVLAASQSLVHVLNATHASVYAYYDSGPEDAAGKILFEEQAIGGSQFTASAAGNVFSTKFSPTIPTTATLKSQNDAAVNRLVYSKPFQPEHVPLANYFDIGTRSKKILRIVALREALLVFKEDGLFRITGDVSSFSVSTLDPTLVLFGKACVASAANACWATTTKGACRITESSSTPIDQPVADAFRVTQRVGTSGWCHVVASEFDGLVYFYLFNNKIVGSFNANNRCMVYSWRTQAWTEAPVGNVGSPASDAAGNLDFWAMPAVSVGGVLYRLDQTTISGNGGLFYEDGVSQTEATAVGAVACGEASPAHKYKLTVTASSLGAHTVTLTNSGGYPFTHITDRGQASIYRLVSGSTFAIYAGSDTFDFTNGTVYGYSPIASTTEWVAYTGGDEAENMRVSEVSVTFDGLSTLTTASLYAYNESSVSTLIGSMTTTTNPLPTGVGTQTVFRCTIPATMQKCRRISIMLTHSAAPEFVFIRGISYVFERTDGHSVT